MNTKSYTKEARPKISQKPKDKPRYKEQRPKKKKNPYLYRGRLIPSRKERTRITKANYEKMIEQYGEYCLLCGHTPIHAHHLVFRSAMGCGSWRNLAPLCDTCHRRAHRDSRLAEQLRENRAMELGPHFGKDKYELFKEGLVHNTTDEAYERFMKGQQLAHAAAQQRQA